MGRNPIDDAKRDEIRRLHAAGISKKAIARRIGVCCMTVRRVLDEDAISFYHINMSSKDWINEINQTIARLGSLVRNLG